VIILKIEKAKSYKKNKWRPPSKKKKRGKNFSQRNMKACHNVSTALLQSVAGIGTQGTVKSSRKTRHEFTSQIPPKKRRKGTEDIFGKFCVSFSGYKMNILIINLLVADIAKKAICNQFKLS
jgi:Tfp pilus assembly protein FimT